MHRDRLIPVVLGKSRPRDRSEEELAGYVSLERIVEDSKEEYYRVLAECSRGWHEGTNKIVPWWNYFLGFVRRACQEFAAQVESARKGPAKGELVRSTILGQVGPFTLGDITGPLPSVSEQLVKKVLAEMKKAGELRLVGRGDDINAESFVDLWHLRDLPPGKRRVAGLADLAETAGDLVAEEQIADQRFTADVVFVRQAEPWADV